MIEKYFRTKGTCSRGIRIGIDEQGILRKIEFEGELFRAPANPDAYLRNIYGNYMQLPPEDKRKGHAVFYITQL